MDCAFAYHLVGPNNTIKNISIISGYIIVHPNEKHDYLHSSFFSFNKRKPGIKKLVNS
jgi:hypothetical protein